MQEIFTIDDLCTVDVTSLMNPTINSVRMFNSELDVDILSYLPKGWGMKIDIGAYSDRIDKTVQVNRLPDFNDLLDLPNGELYKNALGFEWLLEILHEVGHAYNQYEYHDNHLLIRDRTGTLNTESTLKDMTDVLNDEFNAWSFALDRLSELKINHKMKIEANYRINTYLKTYLNSALDPTKIDYTVGITPQEYITQIVALYQGWLDEMIPEFGIDYLKVRKLKENKQYPNEELDGNKKYFKLSNVDEDESSAFNSLSRHLYLAGITGAALFDFKTINIPEMFSIEELKEHSGLIIG
jgi:hypothetical protein